MRPDFLIPRPAPTGAGDQVDLRERLSQAEVHLSSTRASVQRASSELTALRESLERVHDHLQSLTGRITEAEKEALALRERIEASAGSSTSSEASESKLVKLEAQVTSVRVHGTALRHEVDEIKRVEAARGVRIESVEDKLRKHQALLESEPWLVRIEELEARLRTLQSPTARVVEMTAGDLSRVPGIGPKTERQLNDLGVPDRAGLLALDEEGVARIARALGVKASRIESWRERARG